MKNNELKIREDIVQLVLLKFIEKRSFIDSDTKCLLTNLVKKIESASSCNEGFLSTLAGQLSLIVNVPYCEWIEYFFENVTVEPSPQDEYEFLRWRLPPVLTENINPKNPSGDQLLLYKHYLKVSYHLSDCHLEHAGLLVHFSEQASAHAHLTLGCLLWRLTDDDPLVVSQPLLEEARMHLDAGFNLCANASTASGLTSRLVSLMREAKLKFISTSLASNSVSKTDLQYIDEVLALTKSFTRQHKLARRFEKELNTLMRNQDM